jgi:hypothetical protein
MRTAIVLLLALSLAASAFAAPVLDDFYLTAEFAPPHNEPVVGDRVARYRSEAHLVMRWGNLEWHPKLTAWGVQKWRPSDIVGHGEDAWRNSDFSVETVRWSHTQTLKYRMSESLAATTEYYMPLYRDTWGGHGLERHYYWLIGLEWRPLR